MTDDDAVIEGELVPLDLPSERARRRRCGTIDDLPHGLTDDDRGLRVFVSREGRNYTWLGGGKWQPDRDPRLDPPRDIVDAEVVETAPETGLTAPQTNEPPSTDLVATDRDPTVRMKPSGRECWFRLYSTPTSPLRDQQDHGVRDVTVYADQPHRLTLWLESTGNFEVSVLAYRINRTAPAKANALPSKDRRAELTLLGPDSIDLLTEYPPQLPGRRRYWQQMTGPGELTHPGDDRSHWRFADWFNNEQVTGFRFDDSGDSIDFSSDIGAIEQ